jgi:hypothetical protein
MLPKTVLMVPQHVEEVVEVQALQVQTAQELLGPETLGLG